jgi:hypothetical protein
MDTKFRRKNKPVIACAKCGKQFVKNNYNQRFCSAECRDDYFLDIRHEALRFFQESKKNATEN